MQNIKKELRKLEGNSQLRQIPHVDSKSDGKIVIEDSSEGWDEDAEIYEVRD